MGSALGNVATAVFECHFPEKIAPRSRPEIRSQWIWQLVPLLLAIPLCLPANPAMRTANPQRIVADCQGLDVRLLRLVPVIAVVGQAGKHVIKTYLPVEAITGSISLQALDGSALVRCAPYEFALYSHAGEIPQDVLESTRARVVECDLVNL